MLPSSSQWDDIPKRLVTICIGVPVLWILLLDERLRVLFWEGTHIVVAYEWTQMSKPTPVWGFLLSSIVIMHCPSSEIMLAVMVMASAGLTVGWNNTASVSSYLHGWMLISLPFRTWISIASKENGFADVVTLLLTVWNCDTGALLVGRITKGRLLGSWARPLRRRLAVISPNKSIEGLVGGVMFGTLTYIGMPWFWSLLRYLNVSTGDVVMTETVDLRNELLFGLVLSVAAILGDLWESMLKRSFNIKDTGKLLPGHGGILDRFDSTLIAVVVYQQIR